MLSLAYLSFAHFAQYVPMSAWWRESSYHWVWSPQESLQTFSLISPAKYRVQLLVHSNCWGHWNFWQAATNFGFFTTEFPQFERPPQQTSYPAVPSAPSATVSLRSQSTHVCTQRVLFLCCAQPEVGGFLFFLMSRFRSSPCFARPARNQGCRRLKRESNGLRADQGSSADRRLSTFRPRGDTEWRIKKLRGRKRGWAGQDKQVRGRVRGHIFILKKT